MLDKSSEDKHVNMRSQEAEETMAENRNLSDTHYSELMKILLQHKAQTIRDCGDVQ